MAAPETWRQIEEQPEPVESDRRPWDSQRVVLVAVATVTVAAILAAAATALLLGTSAPEIRLPADAVGGFASSAPAPSSGPAAPGPSNTASAPQTILVDVAGAVRHPGLYRLPSGSRVGDAVAAAGGYGPTVDAPAVAARLNLAERLEDGGKILVPERGLPVGSTPPSPGAATGPTSPGGAPLDLNRATATELDTLPGIGPATAAKILASRGQQPFRSVDDLLARKLVRQSVFEGLRDLVKVGG